MMELSFLLEGCWLTPGVQADLESSARKPLECSLPTQKLATLTFRNQMSITNSERRLWSHTSGKLIAFLSWNLPID